MKIGVDRVAGESFFGMSTHPLPPGARTRPHHPSGGGQYVASAQYMYTTRSNKTVHYGVIVTAPTGAKSELEDESPAKSMAWAHFPGKS